MDYLFDIKIVLEYLGMLIDVEGSECKIVIGLKSEESFKVYIEEDFEIKWEEVCMLILILELCFMNVLKEFVKVNSLFKNKGKFGRDLGGGLEIVK